MNPFRLAVCGLLAIGFALGGAASGAVIWSETSITSESDILNTGTFITGVNYGRSNDGAGGHNTAPAVTVNGTNLLAGSNTWNLTGGWNNATAFDFSQQFPAGSAMNDLFSGLVYTGTGTLTITGLIPGNDYRLQWLVAARTQDRTESLTIQGVTGTYHYDGTPVEGPAKNLTATFTASGTSEVVTRSSPQVVINGYVLHQIGGAPPVAIWEGDVDTNYDTPGNWDIGIVPSHTIDAFINAGAGTINRSGHLNFSNVPDAGMTTTKSMTQADGTLTVNGNWIVARNGTGAYTISRGTLVANASSAVGQWGNGTMTQNGGLVDINGLLMLGQLSGGTGTYNQTDGTLDVSSHLSVGYGSGGTGTYNHTGGTADVHGNLLVGRSGTGTYNISGTATAISRSTAAVGQSASGTVNQTGGLMDMRQSLYIGQFSSGSGTYNHSGGTADVQGNLLVGMQGTGTYNISGTATAISHATGAVGQSATGTVNQTGGLMDMRQSLYIGQFSSGTGTYNHSAGTLDVQTYLLVGVQGTGTYNISDTAIARSHNNAAVGQSASGTVNQTGGLMDVLGLYIGQFSGSSGAYNLSGGTLDVDTNLYVGYSGTGTLNVIGSAGTIDVGGNYSQNGASTLRFEMDAAGVSHLDVVGTVTLAGLLDLDFTAIGAPIGDLLLIDNDGSDLITTTFSNYAEGDIVHDFGDGMYYYLTYAYTANDLALVAVVPEPAAAGLLLVGGLLLVPALRRRRR